jgi:hypothetical protein
MNGLVMLAGEALGIDGRSLHLPYGLGLGVGLACDLVARLTARRLAVSAARIRKYAATTRFANARCLASGFKPRHDLHDALVTTIRREFGARAPSGRRPAFFAAKAGERQVT